MNKHAFGFVVLAGASVLVSAVGCSDDSDSTSTSGTGGTATTGTGGSGGAAAGDCAKGIDTECEQCGFAKCETEALACAGLTTCDGDGNATAGCLALVNCAATKCAGGDVVCVAQNCATELDSAGGVVGDGTKAAQALGDCITSSCAMECAPGTGGAGGAG